MSDVCHVFLILNYTEKATQKLKDTRNDKTQLRAIGKRCEDEFFYMSGSEKLDELTGTIVVTIVKFRFAVTPAGICWELLFCFLLCWLRGTYLHTPSWSFNILPLLHFHFHMIREKNCFWMSNVHLLLLCMNTEWEKIKNLVYHERMI